MDKITLSNPGETEADRVKMDELAQTVILTCQGVAFLQGGEEMLRTKGGNSNSYNAGDEANQFDRRGSLLLEGVEVLCCLDLLEEKPCGISNESGS